MLNGDAGRKDRQKERERRKENEMEREKQSDKEGTTEQFFFGKKWAKRERKCAHICTQKQCTFLISLLLVGL